MNTYTIEVVPFNEYDWTFRKPGWLNLNPAAVGLISAFCGIALWMSLELLLLVYVTFKRRRGLYYWSIIITTVGFVLQVVGFILKFFKNDWPRVLVNIIFTIGRVSNVTGFSIVLWSRLHLLVNNQYYILQITLAAIIINSVAMHIPTIVFRFYMMSPQHRSQFVRPLEIMEKVQQTVFAFQETVISGLYIFYAARFLKSGFGPKKRKVAALRLLIAVQVAAILMDAGLSVFDYLSLYTLKCAIHPFVYAVKLKLEFIVLNQLLAIVRDRGTTTSDEENMGSHRDMVPYKSSDSVPGEGEGGFVARMVGRVKGGGTVNSTSTTFSKEGRGSPRNSAHILSSRSFTVESTRCFGIQNPQPTHLGAQMAGLESTQVTTISGGRPGSWSSSMAATPSQSKSSSLTESRMDQVSNFGGEERDLRNMVGSPDDEVNKDLERKYLGRFGL
ncbi:hypothetical protein V8F06_011270 [Rhypophila decipiens]